MSSKLTTNILTYGLLGAAAFVAVMLPASIGPSSSHAGPPQMTGDTTLTFNTIVHDFQKGHPDFTGSISGGTGHYVGNVMTDLGPDGTPAFVGIDATPLTDFKIVNGAVIPQKPFAAMVTVVGAAISMGTSYNMPVTMRGIVASTAYDPFGNFNTPVASNVNKAGNPRSYVIPTVYPAGTAINISGTAWSKKQTSYSGALESHWQIYKSYSTATNPKYIAVLRDGDSAPATAGFMGQVSAKEFLKPYINVLTQKVTLKKNQIIYLFELGTTDLLAAAADFQDLVVLVTLGESANYLATLDAYGNGDGTVSTSAKGYKVATQWRDSEGNPILPSLYNPADGDMAGSLGTKSSGGITSDATFDQWYSDVLGTNLSSQVPLTLKKNSKGVWEYMTNDFHPVDSTMFGNEGKAHNYYFTMNFGLDFTHHAGEKRFIEFQGDDDVWVFIDGKLVMDLGGLSPGVKQRLNVDRLVPALTDGSKHHIEFFYAQRQENTASFNFRTNLDLGEGTTETYTVSGSCD